MRADEASRSKSQTKTCLPLDNSSKKCLPKSRSQEIKTEKSSALGLKSILPKQSSTLNLGTSHLDHERSTGGDNKAGRKGSFLTRSQSFLARLSFRGHVRKDKASTASLAKNSEPNTTVDDGGREPATCLDQQHLTRLDGLSSLNSSTDRDSYHLINTAFMPKPYSDVDYPSERNVFQSKHSQNTASKFSVSSPNDSNVYPTSASQLTIDSQSGINCNNSKNFNPTTTHDKHCHRLHEALKPARVCECHYTTAGEGSISEPHVSLNNSIMTGIQRGNHSQKCGSPNEWISGDDLGDHNTRSDANRCFGVKREYIVSERDVVIPREMHTCPCNDLNCAASGMYRPLPAPLGPDRLNLQSMDSGAGGAAKTVVPLRNGSSSVRIAVSRLSDIPEELTPCQMNPNDSCDGADINRNVTDKNRNTIYERNPPFSGHIPSRHSECYTILSLLQLS